MNFGLDSIIIWSHKDEINELKFERNKVNVITGESQTGKSTIIKIIDYCFLASEHDIPHDVINDNVNWYGLKFYINNKNYFLARKSPHGNRVSTEYFFSSLGEYSLIPYSNINENDLRSILEAEFSIDERVRMPFGSRNIKSGAKISFRYFFLFNTISDDIILNSKIFFDKQDIDRYRDALPRIFDISLGIDTLENIVAREKKENLLREINRLDRKKADLLTNNNIYSEEISYISKKSSEYGLIPYTDGSNVDNDLLKYLHSPTIGANYSASTKKYSDLKKKLYSVNRQLKKCEIFNEEYKSYRDILKNNSDSLRPLQVLIDRSDKVVKSDFFDELISSLKFDLISIKKSLGSRQPVEVQLHSYVKKLKEEKYNLVNEISSLPEQLRSFETLQDMWIFIGEARAKLSVYKDSGSLSLDSSHSDIDDLKKQYEEITILDVESERGETIKLIDEVASGLMKQTNNALENYSDWYASFNYNEKRIQLRKPKSTLIENVGSSSNHMFLHLIHSLSLHEVAINKKSAFIPSFLIVDQPSRPYWGDEEDIDPENIEHSDKAKIKTAFKMLNDFISTINAEYDSEFQIIIFEHVPTKMFDELNNVHILPIFRDGNALIPLSWKS
ncbi:DUF3732 domain-containing protein [Rahnella laticis]|uniref:DUF3732 domain-containing protein n=1 Tax=Rahnella laticis TaxID=2787622 RepID=A0ABS0E171_9GAMM|nr:DUF3732 domain-containing protein [Rahnella laticis]MBF7978561.1 DUF3732 domain-containing protein [Rahnella laticis]MBF7998651.1 DUF3732 domain-containing protein [Rahnella sp. LAC-M12]